MRTKAEHETAIIEKQPNSEAVKNGQKGGIASANINTNPRTENGCITIGKEIFDFYKSYFDKIISIV